MCTNMEDFLRSRGVEEDIIDKLNYEKIDGPCIQLMSDEQLSKYVPKYGDRLSLRLFTNNTNPVKRKQENRKQSLFERLRMKLKRNQSPTKETTQEVPSSRSNNATKDCKTVGIGLMKFDKNKNKYRQVRTTSGGGTRNASLPKSSTKEEILVTAKELFFPKGNSVKLGAETDYIFDVMDYQFLELEPKFTIKEISDITKLKNLRFYLTMRYKELDDDACTSQHLEHSSAPVSSMTRSYSGTVSLNSPAACATVSSTATSSSEYSDFMSQESVSNGDIISNGSLPSLHSLSTATQISADEHATESSNIDIDMLFDQFEDEALSINHHVIRVHRGHVFQELKTKFKDDDCFHFSRDLFTLEMVLPNGESEVAEDNGGVVRDALTEFWNSFVDECTLGNECKVTFLRHDYSDSDWKSIATVIHFGWTTQRYFPICLSKAFMSCAVYGMDIFSESKAHMINEFLSFLPAGESSVLRAALNGEFDAEEIIDILGSHECRVIPSKENLEKLLGEIAHKELIQQPMYIKGCWFNQLTTLGFDLQNTSLDALYDTLRATPRKVSKILSFPDDMTPTQTATSVFLTKFVRELDSDNVSRFLRFCTGSNVMLTDGTGKNKEIFVRFNTLSGLARRPVGHTCGQVLELPEHYDSFLEFRAEFNRLLRSDIWVMDFV